MVVDNLPGMRKIAHQHQWVLQLCHFHLLLKLQARRGRVRYELRGGRVREEIHQLMMLWLYPKDFACRARLNV